MPGLVLILRSRWTLLVLLCCVAAHAQQLRSPWDDLHITLTDAPYTCPDPPPFAKTLDAASYYTDAHHSIIDPKKREAFETATEAPTHLGQWAGLAADAYLTKGSRAAAHCVYSLLDAAARAHAWADRMPTGQASYEQKWLLAATAVSWLKVRTSGLGTSDQEKDIHKWIAALADHVTGYVDNKRNNLDSDAWNNHRYWAGFAVAAAGIALDDRNHFLWGIDSYKAGADQIQPDGTLPHELARAGMALHYHLYALAPLVMIAELASANHTDLYSYRYNAIERLARICEAGLRNPALFAKATGVPQNLPDPISGFEIGWAVPYVKHFPDAQLSAWIAQASTVRFWQWGGLPPGANL